MALEKNTEHEAQAVANLISQFKNKPNLEALVRAFVAQVQDLEDALFQVLLDTVLDTAVGAQLDVLGEIVGVGREDRNDTDYRARIKAQILINKSSGSIEEILEALALILTNSLEFTEFYPASFRIVADDALTVSATEMADIIRDTRSAGVGASFEYTLVADANTFTFADGDIVQSSNNQGFGYAPDGAWAGSTAYVIGQIVTNDTPIRAYVCVTSGTSAGSGGPTGTGSGISDGTIVWDYIADHTSPISIGGEFAEAEAA